MKKLLSGILIFPFFLSAHTTFALSDTLQARKDATNITREGNRIVQEATKSVKKLSDTSVKKIYLDQLNEKKNGIKYIASSISWDTTEIRAKRKEFIQDYFQSLKSLKQEIESNPLSGKISSEERSRIEADILSYQKDLLLPVKEFIDTYGTGDIKSSGDSTFEYKGSLGRAKVSLNTSNSIASLVSDMTDIDATIQTSLDLAIPPETSCDYNANDEYVCTPKTATGRLALDATLELGVSIRDKEVLITPKRFSYIPVALPSTGKYASLSGSLARVREMILTSGGKTTYSLPISSTVSKNIIHADGGKQIEKAREILNLFTSQSILTPLAINTNGYLLGYNQSFYDALAKITDEKASAVVLPYPPIWYNQGTIWTSWIGNFGAVGNIQISRDKNIPKIEITANNLIDEGWNWQYAQTGKNFTTHLSIKNYIGTSTTGNSRLDASLENDMFHMSILTPLLETLYKNTFTYPLPTAPITLDIRGSFSLKNSNLYASLGGHDFAQLKWYYSDTISNLYGWINTYGQDFKLSSESNQTRGTFAYKDYTNVSRENGDTLEKLFAPITK